MSSGFAWAVAARHSRVFMECRKFANLFRLNANFRRIWKLACADARFLVPRLKACCSVRPPALLGGRIASPVRPPRPSGPFNHRLDDDRSGFRLAQTIVLLGVGLQLLRLRLGQFVEMLGHAKMARLLLRVDGVAVRKIFLASAATVE